MEVLVLCGPAGVGKSTVAFETALLLARQDVSHALIDSDQLDHVHPWPPPGWEPSELSRRNLRSIWETYAALGHCRLILVGVFVDLAYDRAWIEDAIPAGRFTVVRLSANREVLCDRVTRREVGSGRVEQLRRTLGQAESIADPPDVITIDTSAQRVRAIADSIVERLAWQS